MLGDFNKDVYETSYKALCERMGLQIEKDRDHHKTRSGSNSSGHISGIKHFL